MTYEDRGCIGGLGIPSVTMLWREMGTLSRMEKVCII